MIKQDKLLKFSKLVIPMGWGSHSSDGRCTRFKISRCSRENISPECEMEYSVVCYNERSYNERMLQRTVFINKIRMLQRTRRNTIGRRSTSVRMTCRAFRLFLERRSSSLLLFVRFSYQFSSVICLFVVHKS